MNTPLSMNAWSFCRSEYWIVTDLLHGEGSHTYDLRFHLAPRALGRTTCALGIKAHGYLPRIFLSPSHDCRTYTRR